MPIVHWFRRDFRLHDNTALARAAVDSADGVVPVFVFDDAILRHPDTGAPIVAFMLECLRELRDGLRAAGGELVFLHGRPVEELRRVARATGATAIYYNKDYAPGAVERDEEVERTLGKEGVVVRGFKDQVIFEEQEILSAGKGEPYTVFTPYRNAWLKRLAGEFGELGPEPGGKAKLAFGASLGRAGGMELPTVEGLGFVVTHRPEIEAGEAAARKRLKQFCASGLRGYLETRNLPSKAGGSSRLSPHLRHGTLSPRQCVRAALWVKKEGGSAFAAGADAWVAELVWREFYQQILYNFPEVEREPFKARWREVKFPEVDEAAWKAWCDGATGYPIVDAAMRQLNATGWMHNRLRMIVAMFLTKDLLVDYRMGERYFMQRLIDGETAQNNGGWQWSASCGTDAQPWFRIFNPARQSEKFDPDGAFIRQYCPGLAKVPEKLVHAPQEMTGEEQEEAGCVIGRDYPAPVVDHDAARLRALEFMRGRAGGG